MSCLPTNVTSRLRSSIYLLLRPIRLQSFTITNQTRFTLIGPYTSSPGAATAVSSFAAGHWDEEAAVPDMVSPGLPAGRGRGSGMAFAVADV